MNAGDLRHEDATARLRERAWQQVDASVVITDGEGRIVDWNGGAARLFGWTADEAIGARWDDLAGPVAADPDPRRAQIRDRLDDAGAYTGELTVATKGGERIPILVSGGRVRDEDGRVIGSIGIAIDDRRRSLAEERFELAFREAPIASVITTGERQLILDVNPAFEALSGLARHDAIGRTSDELGLWDDPETSTAILELTHRQAPLSEASIAFRARSGAVVRVRLSGRPIQLSDGPAYLWMAVDETDRLRAAEQLQRAQRLEAVGLLAGGIAHDFNNIMTTIRGTASLAADQVGRDHPIAPDLAAIVHATERAAGMTQQLLAFSGRLVLRPERLDLLTIAREMEPTLSRLAPPGSHVLVTGDAPGWIHADPGQIRQVLLNLAMNAFDAMPAGGTLRIKVGVRGGTGPKGPAGVRLIVTDDGTGMTDAVRSRILEPFFTTKPVGHGTGLGLAVVHGIIEQSGGTIEVESSPGNGSTFSIDLPAADPEVPLVEAVAAGPLADDRAATILLVEDEAAIRLLARRVLERRGHRVVEAEDGVAALEALADLESLDLVLTDLTMPRMGGVEMVSRLAGLRPNVPVIFMSGYGESALAQDGVLDPTIRLLSKPFSIDDLAGMVHRALAERD